MSPVRRRPRGSTRHRRIDVRVRFAPLPPEDVVVVRGLRVTSVARTLVDLAGDLSRDEVVRIARQALDKGMVTIEELRRVAESRDDLPSIDCFRQVMREIDRP